MTAPAHLPEIIAARYRPIRLIATGGMGAVYEVEHAATGQRLALKVLASGANASPEALVRFRHEVRASARIKSENVIRVIDADLAPELGGAPFLVMELLEGADLERAAAAALPTPAAVVEWLRQVARALDKAHHLGMVHRDLKPENLFLTTRDDGAPLVKILDFGIVKMVEEATAATSTGQILGTPKYMAPEQATANASVTPATDRCALGLIAYRLLMGESYYQGGVMIILGQLLHAELQPPSERGSRFGDSFDAWFLKACHRDPGKRFASAAEQIEALAESLGIHDAAIGPTRETSSRPDARPGARRTRRVVLAAAAIATVLVAAGITGRLATTGKREQPGVCGLPSVGATEACGPCMAEACCNEAEECSGIQGCAPLEACIRACGSGDTMCRSRCYAAAGPVADFQQGLESCRAAHCAKECLPGPWECLGRVKWRYPSLMPKTIGIKTTAVCLSCGAGGGQAPLPGVTVRLCSLADPKCGLPLAESITDDRGAAILRVDTSLYPPPLAAFVEHKKGGYMDTLAHVNMPPIGGDLDIGRTKLLDPKVNAAPSAAMLGTKLDPTRAIVDVLAIDCNGQPAPKNVVVTWLDRDGQTATTPYFVYSKSTHAINVPVNDAGVVRIVVRVAETNQLVTTANIVVRPGALSLVNAAPAP
jgi:hypothetical protein